MAAAGTPLQTGRQMCDLSTMSSGRVSSKAVGEGIEQGCLQRYCSQAGKYS